MTIKEFALLCGCNPQTLRYYDQVDLLKPVKVDRWSGYRFYEEEQALVFVKIKNLQMVGFTIEEIKGLLKLDDQAIYRAFGAKITEAEDKLRKIKEIQSSYRAEMNQIQKKINEVREQVVQIMRQYDPTVEFGIDAVWYAGIVNNVSQSFDGIDSDDVEKFNYEDFRIGADAEVEEEEEYLDPLNNPDYEVIYEKHGWANVRDFLSECSDLNDGGEYALYFRLTKLKQLYGVPFMNTILGILLAENSGKKINLSCNVEKTDDGQNHFWLLSRK